MSQQSTVHLHYFLNTLHTACTDLLCHDGNIVRVRFDVSDRTPQAIEPNAHMPCITKCPMVCTFIAYKAVQKTLNDIQLIAFFSVEGFRAFK